jgi:hypothetical protein
MLSYAEQIKHPLWQKKRLEVLSANNWICQDCKAFGQTLHVHHTAYKKGRMLWEYEVDELRCLCDLCHNQAHERLQDLQDIFVHLPVGMQHTIIAFARKLAQPDIGDTPKPIADIPPVAKPSAARWDDFLAYVKTQQPLLSVLLEAAHCTQFNQQAIKLGFPQDSFHFSVINDPEQKSLIATLFNKFFAIEDDHKPVTYCYKTL